MRRREGVVMTITLALLHVFVIAAALAVVKLTPNRSLTLEPPSVAARTVVTDDTSLLPSVGGSAPLPSSGALASALAGRMAGTKNLTGVVADVATGRVLFQSGADVGATPASVTKLATSTAVLASPGPAHQISTRVVRTATGIVLVGGGDPTLTTAPSPAAFPHAATLSSLAAQVAATLKGQRVRVDDDSSLFSGPKTGPGWTPTTSPAVTPRR